MYNILYLIIKASTRVPSFILNRPKLSLFRNNIFFVAKQTMKSPRFSDLFSKTLSRSCIRGSLINGQCTHGKEVEKFYLVLPSFRSSVDCSWQQNL
jgi:hypothetical protein